MVGYLGLGLKGKIVLPALIVLVLLTVSLVFYVSIKFYRYNNDLIFEKVIGNTHAIEFFLRKGAEDSKVAAILKSRDPNTIAALKTHDRNKVLDSVINSEELCPVEFYTFADNQGIVLARTHAPNSYGDSVFHRLNFQRALAGETDIFFDSSMDILVAIRTCVPVYDTDGTVLGVVSSGIRYDTEEAVDYLKNHIRCEVSIFFNGTRVATTIRDKTGQRIIGTMLDSKLTKIVIDEKSTFFGKAKVSGIEYMAVYKPLLNSSEEVIAVIAFGYPLKVFEKQTMTLIRDIIGISFVGLVISAVILFWVISTVSKPILSLAEEMQKIESGKLSVVIDVSGNDEVGHAGKSLQRVADVIHKLVDNINETISEHQKGNLEYRLDISGFHGAYRLLAERIVKLSKLGMNDPLTGLPNRRSFDSRTEMEWYRAMRGKTPLSLLMLDVDRFKTYNDLFGHQVGDVVLQAVAKAISLRVKRGYDFVARYGGEEFAILLPNTNLDGALYIAEVIRAGIEDTEIPGIDGGQPLKVTVSIGVGTLNPTSKESIEKLVAHADAALYQAKESGRNRVCAYGVDE